MRDVCKNCGREIRVQIFKGGDWCSGDCRKALLGQMKCSYELIWTEEVGGIEVCTVHGHNSKYSPVHGPHRPCLAVEDWDYEVEGNVAPSMFF
jgi:hypothetical protein